MRGGTQALLIQASDKRFYVVKLRNNPQHPRVLVNELIGSILLNHLQITTPPTTFVWLSEEFLRENAEVSIHIGARCMPAAPGWHFGSQYPGDPDCVAVYDFIPSASLPQVLNLLDFRGALVFDKWTANTDWRQAIFSRVLEREQWAGVPATGSRRGFVASMIDQGSVFNGPQWNFPDSPLHGLYHPLVYAGVNSIGSFQPWLDSAMGLPEAAMTQVARQVPFEWFHADQEALTMLLEQLLQRRKDLPDLIRKCHNAKPSFFPDWI
jgi:hypothetical protein